ncbi:MAG: hypothetical protein K2J58_05465, partial [Muribaculaceae bacterium]|nr:hypothetical protein [Muribaculaceae bacterium]
DLRTHSSVGPFFCMYTPMVMVAIGKAGEQVIAALEAGFQQCNPFSLYLCTLPSGTDCESEKLTNFYTIAVFLSFLIYDKTPTDTIVHFFFTLHFGPC